MKNFYEGFEGEPELVVSLKGNREEAFSAWVGHFDNVMIHVNPGPEGWDGLAEHYHCDTGYNDGLWRDPNPSDTAKMLRSVMPKLRGECREFAEQFLDFAERAAKTGCLELALE
jgi:hypothetical protein